MLKRLTTLRRRRRFGDRRRIRIRGGTEIPMSMRRARLSSVAQWAAEEVKKRTDGRVEISTSGLTLGKEVEINEGPGSARSISFIPA